MTFHPRVMLSAVFATLAVTSTVSAQEGFHLTRNGFRAPVFGVSQTVDANGNVVAECATASTATIEAARFGRQVSRAMQAISPQGSVTTEGGATFEVTYIDPEGAGFNHPGEGGNRRAALEAALAAWSKVIKAEQPIRVSATMRTIDDGDNNPNTNILALGGPAEFWLVENMAVPSALTWQLIGSRVETAKDADITIDVNDRVDWDYSLNGQAPSNRHSFIYTMMHELAHGLGFIQSFDPATGKIANEPYAFPYDKFVNRGAGGPNRVMDHAPEEQLRDYKSRDLFFNGESANEASQRSTFRPGPMVRLFAPDPYQPASSIGHVDQDSYADIRTGLMTPLVGRGSDKIDPLTLAIMKDLGYTLVENPVTSVTPTRTKQ